MESYLKNLIDASAKSLKTPGKSPKLPKEEGLNSTLFVFRHGQTYDNFRRIFSGRRDSKLTPLGVLQAKKLAFRLKGKIINIVYTPNLKRCLGTLEAVLKYHPLTEIKFDDNLLERDYGELTGKSKLKLHLKNPVLCAKYRRAYDFPPPAGESLKEVNEKRVLPFCRKLEKEIKETKKNIAVSGTNNTMRLIRMYFEKLTVEEMQSLENPLAQDYCAYRIR